MLQRNETEVITYVKIIHIKKLNLGHFPFDSI